MTTQVDPSIISIESDLTADAIESGRKTLREMLSAKAPDPRTIQTIGDCVAFLVSDGKSYPAEAAYLVRYLAVPNFLPESNSSNNLHRNIVSLAERSLPGLCDFLKVPDKRQTYEKIQTLIGGYAYISSLLEPMRAVPPEAVAFVSSKQAVFQAMNHSTVRAYCAPFGLASLKGLAETCYARLSKLNIESEMLPVDVREAQAAIDDGIIFCKLNPTFLTNQFGQPFFSSASKGLENFVKSARSRLAADIISVGLTNDYLQKRHPLKTEGRIIQFSIPLANKGPGRAFNVSAQIASNDEIALDREEVNLGTITPGNFALALRGLVVTPVPETSFMISISWNELGSAETKSIAFVCRILSQDEIDWSKLEFERPYTVEVAEGNAFVGRSEQVRAVANKMLRTPMEPFYVAGQRRIGKTSLAKAAAAFAKDHEKGAGLRIEYLAWGEVAHVDPRTSLKNLGERIARFMLDTFPAHTPFSRELNFEGSLSQLSDLANHAKLAAPHLKYVVIIDEFDDIPAELYVKGNLAETFFSNLRAISTIDNFCLAFVGGENMPYIMDRQGQKLNRFVSIGLDYFSRDTEWDDFTKLVRHPTDRSINWHDDAISEVFNFSNGNPYFAKMICGEIFSSAVHARDADVTGEDVLKAIARHLSQMKTNFFAHLWQDGINSVGTEREPEIDRRRRFLVIVARTMRGEKPLTLENFAKNKSPILPTTTDIIPILNDFVRRNILTEDRGEYRFVLPVFGLWLAEFGISALASDTVGEDLAKIEIAAEELAYVTSSEIEKLIKEWPSYQGKLISGETVRAWLNQIPRNRDRRLLFTLLEHVRFFDEQNVRQSLRTAYGIIRPSLPPFVQKKRSHRRTDLIITYIDGEGKSGQYYSSKYAEENGISTQSIISPENFSVRLQEYVLKHGEIAALIIVDDIVSTGMSLADNLEKFWSTHKESILQSRLPTTAVVLVATVDGEAAVRQKLSKLEGFDVDLRVCEHLSPKHFAFDPQGKVWTKLEDYEEAKALCTELGARIYPDNPLGYGNQGLLVVFPETCPNNSLPILHSGRQSWTPLFPRLIN